MKKKNVLHFGLNPVLQYKFVQKILFTDEKIFTIEQKCNKQNDKVYARTSYEDKAKVPRIQRGNQPSSVMVWWGLSWNGTIVIHFCTPRVKTTAKIYEETVSVPTHKSKCCQQWLAINVPASDGKYRYNKVSILQGQLSISIDTSHLYSEAMFRFFDWVR